MGIPKSNAKALTALGAQVVTMKELIAMSEFIKTFNEKYGRRKSTIRKKK
jgi:hypothetical protein